MFKQSLNYLTTAFLCTKITTPVDNEFCLIMLNLSAYVLTKWHFYAIFRRSLQNSQIYYQAQSGCFCTHLV